MKSRKINNLLNIKSRKNKIKNNSTRRENFNNNNNKTFKNKQEKCEKENKPILKHLNITHSGLGDKLMDLWASATISILIKHKLYVKMKSCKRHGIYDNNLNHTYNFNNIKIPNTKIILNDYDKSYELFSKNETLIDDNLHLSCSRFMSTNTPYYIHQDRDKYYNSKLKYNVNNYSYNEIIDTFKYVAYNTKLLLKNDDKKLDIYNDYIGIHIRATDKIVKNSRPWEMTIEYFNQLIILSTNYCKTLINDKNYNYVICSDDKNMAFKFKNNLLEFSNNINVIISDNIPEIDMIILSKTKQIIQISRSTNFTICASLLGNNKVKFFYDEMNDYDNSFYHRKHNELLLPDNDYHLYEKKKNLNILYRIMKEKIALCFLTYDNLSQPKLWENFINSKYNIYIHNKDKFTGVFEQYCINNKVETKRGHISLIKATLNLFKEAFQTEDNKFFVLLSDKCIPLYSPDVLHKKITEINNNMLNSFKTIPGTDWHNMRYGTIAKKDFFDEDNFYGQHQWIILKRDTVKFFIENDYIDLFGNCCDVPDETYFINIMNKFNIPSIQKTVTYVNWNEDSDMEKYAKRPKTYSKLSNENIENILKSDPLFMRKVGPECDLPSYFDLFLQNQIL